jgi:flagellar export protein FliJ
VSARAGGRALSTLLSLRHLAAETARGQYAAAAAERRGREEALHAHVDALAAADLSEPGAWAAAVARRELLRNTVVRSRDDVVTARTAEDDARGQWTHHRRAERVVEKLVERAEAAAREAERRADQREMDEIAIVAHGRRHLTAGGL